MIPALTPPPDSHGVGSGGAGNNLDSFYSSLRLETKASRADLVTHYVRQLENAGWRVQDRLDGKATVVVVLSAPSKTGEPVTAYLAAQSLQGSGDTDMFLRVMHNVRDSRTPGFVGSTSLSGGLAR